VLQKAGSGAAAETAGMVGRQVEQMTRLVEDLLDLTRVTRGKVSLAREPLELTALVGKTLDELAAAGRLGRHALSRELSPVWVRADPARVAQIVANLVGNAVKYTPAGGRVTVSLAVPPGGDGSDAGTVMIRVADTGVGIRAHHLPHLFDKFYRVEDTSTAGIPGTGLGLAIAKSIVDGHGGRIGVESTEGSGSVFWVALPQGPAA
jgi:signal transduction histidine kinase